VSTLSLLMNRKTIVTALLVCIALYAPLSVFSQDFQMNGTVLVKYNGKAANVTIPAGVTAIEDNAFLFCSLTSITIPASVTSIGDQAFDRSGLTSIMVAADNPNYASEGGILYNKAKTKIIFVPGISGSVTIPAGVTSIEAYAFMGRSLLTSITIPSSVTSIGYMAFNGCSSLTSVTIPASVTSIEYMAFYRCPLTPAVRNDIVKRFGERPLQGYDP